MTIFKYCLDCDMTYDAESWICPNCYKKQSKKFDIRKTLYDKNNKNRVKFCQLM